MIDDLTATARAKAVSSTAGDLVRPGHVLPLRARPGGVLERPGRTEAAVDLCALAGLSPVAVIAELVSDDGSMLRPAQIDTLGARHDLPVLAVTELIAYRKALLDNSRSEHTVRRSASTQMVPEPFDFVVAR